MIPLCFSRPVSACTVQRFCGLKRNEEKLKKCGFTKLSNGLRDKLLYDDLSKLEYKIFFSIFARIHGFKNSKDYVTIYQVKKNTGLWHGTIVKTLEALNRKGFLVIRKEGIKTKIKTLIFTKQSYYCHIKSCINCNPYKDLERICQDPK